MQLNCIWRSVFSHAHIQCGKWCTNLLLKVSLYELLRAHKCHADMPLACRILQCAVILGMISWHGWIRVISSTSWPPFMPPPQTVQTKPLYVFESSVPRTISHVGWDLDISLTLVKCANSHIRIRHMGLKHQGQRNNTVRYKRQRRFHTIVFIQSEALLWPTCANFNIAASLLPWSEAFEAPTIIHSYN